MTATVIDTLRYADRLKQAGVESGQAEAMSRALNDELTEGLATRKDLDDAVSELKGDIGGLGNRIDALETKFDALETKFDGLDTKFGAIDTKFGAIDTKFGAMDTKFGAMDTKFGAVDTKIDALRGQNRYVFLVLALIAGLGLYNATAPHFLDRGTRLDESNVAQPVAQTPTRAATNQGN